MFYRTNKNRTNKICRNCSAFSLLAIHTKCPVCGAIDAEGVLQSYNFYGGDSKIVGIRCKCGYKKPVIIDNDDEQHLPI